MAQLVTQVPRTGIGGVVNLAERYEIKVSEFRKVIYKTEFEEKLRQRWERICGEVVGWVGEE